MNDRLAIYAQREDRKHTEGGDGGESGSGSARARLRVAIGDGVVVNGGATIIAAGCLGDAEAADHEGEELQLLAALLDDIIGHDGWSWRTTVYENHTKPTRA